MIERIALGTVQFGLSYGVANRDGQMSRTQAGEVIQYARRAGLNTLDTAAAYGDSEARLGEIGVRDWRVVTKLPPMTADVTDGRSWVLDSLHQSLARLGALSRIDGLLLHRSTDLLGGHGAAVRTALIEAKNAGLVAKVGVSIYDPRELDALWPEFQPELVQAPFNVLDRRLALSGWLRRLHELGVEIHTRSTFLQGLLLMPEGDRPAKFSRWRDLLSAWTRWTVAEGITPLQACIAHTLAHPEIARVVVGVDNIAQLKEILSAARRGPARAPCSLASEDSDLIDPSRWASL